ncbi:MAG: OmpA family protein, partial [Bacteroidales bacterium]
MKLQIITLALLSMSAVNNIQAQKSKRGPYETNKFFDNWFISAGGGMNLYEGEEDNQGKFGKRLAPTWDISLGKWITPTVGLRMQYSGGEAKGNTSLMSDFMRPGKTYKGLYREKFRMNVLH